MHKLHLTAVLALFLVSPLASAIGIDSCVRLNQSGSYQLISDIETSTGACITIDNNSITLDCNYYSIRTTGTSHPAILVSALKENITITHCNISTTGYNSPGIYPLEYSNLNITYNTINTNDSNSAGILLYRSQFDNITGNIINTAGDA